MAKRKQPPSLKRRAPQHQPKIVLYVFCEGQNTEPFYLRDFSNAWGNKLVKMIPYEAAGVPLTLIKAASAKKIELDNVARKGRNSFDSDFQVWGVFDVDEHPSVEDAKQMARSAGVNVAISNPCFDLWALLHFHYQDAHIHRHKVQKALTQVMPNYDGNKSKIFDYELMHSRYEVAKRNAEGLLKRRKEEGTPAGNPSTDVFHLLDIIIKNGKIF